MKRQIAAWVALSLALSVFSAMVICPPQKAHAQEGDESDFEGNEDYYNELCTTRGSELTDEQKQTCRLYSDWISKKIADVSSVTDSLKSSISSIKSDLSAMQDTINELTSQIQELENQIGNLNAQIELIEANIAELQAEIDDRNQRIDELNNQIMARMVNIQPYVSLNKYIEFIMGASDFTDLLRRVSAVNEIMDYDTGQIELLQEEKKKLQQDQEDMQEQENQLNEKRGELESSQAVLEDTRATQEELFAEAQQQQYELEAQLNEQMAISDEYKAQLSEISKAISYVAPSYGWVFPVSGGFTISGGAWAYWPGGPTHLGVDFATSTSNYVVAVANGVVIATHDGEAQYGYYGNWCGVPAGGGNTVAMVVFVNGHTYGVYYNHMSPGLYVSPGDVVSQGDYLGHVGSSGNSTGPHCHVDVFDLGEADLATAISYYSIDRQFGVGWRLSNRCGLKGVPCRLNPQDIFNVYYGYSNY